MKRMLIKVLILTVLCLASPSCMAHSIQSKSVNIVAYTEACFLLAEKNGIRTAVSMYEFHGDHARLIWSNEYAFDADFDILPLPGIAQIALLSENKVYLLTQSGSFVTEFVFDKHYGWHYPIFSAGMRSVACSDAKYQNILTITEQGITIVDVTGNQQLRAANDAIVTLFAFVDDKGTVYHNKADGDGYWTVDIAGNWAFTQIDGQLAYVAADGAWVLSGQTLLLPGGDVIVLPKTRGGYAIGVSHHAGVIISDKLVVSAQDRQLRRWAFSSEERYGFSQNLHYFLSEGEYEDQINDIWIAWSLERGERSIAWKHKWTNPDIDVIAPGYIVLDGGIALMIGSADTSESWQLWALSIDRKESTMIDLR